MKVGEFLLIAQNVGAAHHGKRRTTIIVCNLVGKELGKVDADELKTAINALEETCWRL